MLSKRMYGSSDRPVLCITRKTFVAWLMSFCCHPKVKRQKKWPEAGLLVEFFAPVPINRHKRPGQWKDTLLAKPGHVSIHNRLHPPIDSARRIGTGWIAPSLKEGIIDNVLPAMSGVK
jgi:hypothetical protein